MPAPWFCKDVSGYLIVSTIDLTNHGHRGNQAFHAQKLPWTRELEDLASGMRAEGCTWVAIIKELEDRTGVRIASHSVQDYLARKGEV